MAQREGTMIDKAQATAKVLEMAETFLGLMRTSRDAEGINHFAAKAAACRQVHDELQALDALPAATTPANTKAAGGPAAYPTVAWCGYLHQWNDMDAREGGICACGQMAWRGSSFAAAPAVPAPADAEPSVIGADVAPIPFTKADVLSEAEHQAMDGDVGERCAMMLRLLANILWPQSAPADAERPTIILDAVEDKALVEQLELAVEGELTERSVQINSLSQLQYNVVMALLPIVKQFRAPADAPRWTAFTREQLEMMAHAIESDDDGPMLRRDISHALQLYAHSLAAAPSGGALKEKS